MRSHRHSIRGRSTGVRRHRPVAQNEHGPLNDERLPRHVARRQRRVTGDHHQLLGGPAEVVQRLGRPLLEGGRENGKPGEAEVALDARAVGVPRLGHRHARQAATGQRQHAHPHGGPLPVRVVVALRHVAEELPHDLGRPLAHDQRRVGRPEPPGDDPRDARPLSGEDHRHALEPRAECVPREDREAEAAGAGGVVRGADFRLGDLELEDVVGGALEGVPNEPALDLGDGTARAERQDALGGERGRSGGLVHGRLTL